MKHGLYSVFDVKAKAYIQPFCLPTDAMALRAFADCVNDQGHMFGKHPEDYALYRMGTFDDEIGVSGQTPEVLQVAHMLKEVA